MVKSKWQVFSNIINGYQKYRVGRKLRDNEPLHSGNVLYVGGFMDSQEEAQQRAEKFNNYNGKVCPMDNEICSSMCRVISSGVECPFKEGKQ